jgi:hypothetical protein
MKPALWIDYSIRSGTEGGRSVAHGASTAG